MRKRKPWVKEKAELESQGIKVDEDKKKADFSNEKKQAKNKSGFFKNVLKKGVKKNGK